MNTGQKPSEQERNDAYAGKGQTDTRAWSYQDRQAYVGQYKQQEQSQTGKK